MQAALDPIDVSWAAFLENPDEILPTYSTEIPGEEEGYKSVEKLLWKICHGFVAHFGQRVEDYLGDAQLIWLKAHRRYDPNFQRVNPNTGKVVKVSYSTWINNCVFRGLMGVVSARFKDRERLPLDVDHPLDEATATVPFRLKTLLNEVSEEAAIVIRLSILSTPASDSRADVDEVRDNVASLLVEELGWSAKDVFKCFQEVREALAS